MSRPPSGAHDGGFAGLLALAKRVGNAAVDRLLGARRDKLDGSTAARFGALYGADLSTVRIVREGASHTVADALDAVAFTADDTVFLGDRAPPLSSAAGEMLLAHELAHIVQQRNATVVEPRVSAASDAHERQADAGAAGTRDVAGSAAAVPAVQRKEGDAGTPAPSPTPVPKGIARAEARAILERYFESKRTAQGGTAVRMSDDVKSDIRRIVSNDLNSSLRMEGFLSRTIFPGDASELAEEVASRLPDPIDPARLAHLGERSPAPGRFDRVKDVVEKTAPYESPDTLERKWEFDRQAKESRRGEKAIGPFGVDVLRAYNVGKGLPGALKTPTTPAPEAKTYPDVEAAIATVSANALVPAEARGSTKAMNYADAQLVARDLARMLDDAHEHRNESISLKLGIEYAGVKDREAMITEVARLVHLIRDALPHHAGGVSAVDLYFGDRLVRRIPLAASTE